MDLLLIGAILESEDHQLNEGVIYSKRSHDTC